MTAEMSARLPPVDYDRMASSFNTGRSLSVEGMNAWCEPVGRHLPPADGRPILDLGSGTGLFSTALNDWFGVPVVGLEPSQGMRQRALAKSTPAAVWFVGGRAEKLPFPDRVFGVAWLSTVIHHFSDVGGALAELRRVLVAGSPVLVRNAFVEHLDAITWVRYFPEARPLIAARWPRLEDVVAAFISSGFEAVAFEMVSQVSAPSLGALADRVLTRADSTLVTLDDRSFANGEERLRAAAKVASGPVVDKLGLLVLRARA